MGWCSARPQLQLRSLFLLLLLLAPVRTAPLPRARHMLVQGQQAAAWQQSRLRGYLLWSEPHRFLLCVTQKVACSEWLKYMHEQLTGRIPMGRAVYARQSKGDLHFFDRTQAQDVAKVMSIAEDRAWRRFVVMRHPWTRLLSAYRSKIEGTCKGSVECARTMFQLDVPRQLTSLTFHDFVVIVTATSPQKLNPHMMPQIHTCNIAYLPYDIVHLESAYEMDTVSHAMGFNVTFSQSRAGDAARRYNDATYKHGVTSHVQPCTEATVRLAADFYAADAMVGGYTFDTAFDSCSRYGLSEVRSGVRRQEAGKKRGAAPPLSHTEHSSVTTTQPPSTH